MCQSGSQQEVEFIEMVPMATLKKELPPTTVSASPGHPPRAPGQRGLQGRSGTANVGKWMDWDRAA